MEPGAPKDEYQSDCAVICLMASEYLEINISPSKAKLIWKEWSLEFGEAWLSLPPDSEDGIAEILGAIKRYFRERNIDFRNKKLDTK